MKAGHLLYRVENLENAVTRWRNKGFVVEYGRCKNPNNALIYFSKGPYVELLETTGMPKILQKILALFGKKGAVKRFEEWEKGEDGWKGFCIENQKNDLRREVSELRNLKKTGFYLKNGKREDIYGRVLRYQCFFPNDLGLPFFMSSFSVNPKPENFVHPNGISHISKIVFSTNQEAVKVLKSFLKDDSVQVEVGEQVGMVREVFFWNNIENEIQSP